MTDINNFLPITYEDMLAKGYGRPDFVIVTGDAYVDHPSFGTAVIGRVLENAGYNIAILPQPKFNNEEDFKRFGEPKYGFLIGAGNVDSMVAHYTAAKKKRSDDYYSPGKKAGLRPDRAVTVYAKLAKAAYPNKFVMIGSIEASLRRFAHYDYWADTVMPSVLVDSGADMLCYGMSERSIVQIAKAVAGRKDYTNIKGTCVLLDNVNGLSNYVECASYENVVKDKNRYAQSVKIQYDEHDFKTGKTVIQKHGDKILVQHPPQAPLERDELDKVFALPFTREYHPSYDEMGGVPAIEEVSFSIIHNRGCFGGCNFCALAFHQGRYVTSRSPESVLNEARKITLQDGFKGYIHDVGGPTANFTTGSCDKQKKHGMCTHRKCLAPSPCPSLKVDHREYKELLLRIQKLDKVKRVFVRSGIRFDYIMADKDDSFMKNLVKNNVSGQLKVAPEHCSANVLDAMGKPRFETYKKFSDKFYSITKSIGKKQYLVPYLMSSHPGSTIKDAIKLSCYLKENNLRPEQVQDYYPTPGTLSTCMYYTGINPVTGKEIFVPKTMQEKRSQRMLLQYFKRENYEEIRKILIKAGRADLIGSGKNCLVPKGASSSNVAKKENEKPKARRNHRYDKSKKAKKFKK